MGGGREDPEEVLDCAGGVRSRVAADILLKHRIAEVICKSFTQYERKIRVLQVALTPAEHGRIDGHDNRLITCRLRTCQKAGRQPFVARPVELEPSRRVTQFPATSSIVFEEAVLRMTGTP